MLGLAKGRFQITHIEHANARALAVEQGLVCRHIPVVDHKGPVEPGLAAHQHGLAHGLRHPRANGALVLEQAHIGGDAHIVQKQRCGADAAHWQGALRVNNVVDVVDQWQVLVEQNAGAYPGQRPALRIGHGKAGQHDQRLVLDAACAGCGAPGGDERNVQARRKVRCQRQQLALAESL